MSTVKIKITKMNGKPFTHFSMTNCGQPFRVSEWGCHTSLRTAQNTIKKCSKYVGCRGWNWWVQDATGNKV